MRYPPLLFPFAVIAVALWGSVELRAAELQPITSLVSLEQQLLADAADGRLDRHTLLEGALIAGGVQQPEQLLAAESHLETKWRELDEPSLSKLPPRERVRLLLAALHRLLLTGKYKADCTEAHATLATGDFNCVTATVLFLELSRRNQVPARSIAVPGHVYCRLSLEPQLDIQTTCRDWLEICEGRLNTPEAKALQTQLQARGQHARELSDVQLVGKVYYNRGVSLLEQQDFAGAIDLLQISLRLDAQDQPARNNLLAAYNNWALALCDRGEFAAAAAKLAEGRKHDPQYAPLLTNDLHVHQKWVLSLCDRGRYAEALELLEHGYQRRPEAPLFAGGRFAVCGLWSQSLLASNQIEGAVQVFDQARQRFGDHAELVSQELAAWEGDLAKRIAAGEMQAARQLLKLARQRHPQAESLQRWSERLE